MLLNDKAKKLINWLFRAYQKIKTGFQNVTNLQRTNQLDFKNNRAKNVNTQLVSFEVINLRYLGIWLCLEDKPKKFNFKKLNKLVFFFFFAK